MALTPMQKLIEDVKHTQLLSMQSKAMFLAFISGRLRMKKI